MFKFLFELSIFKTIYINAVYIPFPKLFRTPILVSRYVRIRSAKGKVVIGSYERGSILLGFDGVGVFDNRRSRSIWEVGDGIVKFAGRATLGNGFKICVQDGGVLEIGSQFKMTAESTVICYKSISFGNNCLISWDCLIMDTDFHSIYSLGQSSDIELINGNEDIVIDDNVWIGCRSIILKGCYIPKGSIIAAGATITKELTTPNSIYYNNKLIKQNINWKM